MKKAIIPILFIIAVVVLILITATLMWPTPGSTVKAILAALEVRGGRVALAGFSCGDKLSGAGDGPVIKAPFSRLGAYAGEVMVWTGEAGACAQIDVRIDDNPFARPFWNAGLRARQIQEMYELAERSLAARFPAGEAQRYAGEDALGYASRGFLLGLPDGTTLELRVAQLDDCSALTLRVMTAAAWLRIAAKRSAEWETIRITPVVRATAGVR